MKVVCRLVPSPESLVKFELSGTFTLPRMVYSPRVEQIKDEANQAQKRSHCLGASCKQFEIRESVKDPSQKRMNLLLQCPSNFSDPAQVCQ